MKVEKLCKFHHKVRKFCIEAEININNLSLMPDNVSSAFSSNKTFIFWVKLQWCYLESNWQEIGIGPCKGLHGDKPLPKPLIHWCAIELLGPAQRHNDVETTSRRRFGVIMALSLRHVPVGSILAVTVSTWLAIDLNSMAWEIWMRF